MEDKYQAESKKEEPETRSYASSSNNFPVSYAEYLRLGPSSDLGEVIKVFKEKMEALKNLLKLFKSDFNKPLPWDISDSTVLGSNPSG